MKRLQLPELEDYPWFPALLRNGGTDAMALAVNASGVAARMAPIFAAELRKAGTREVVDLASGGGGPLPTLIAAVVAAGGDVHVTLTDLHPNVAAFRRLAAQVPGRIEFRTDSIDATAVPEDLRGMRVMFNSFHHLPPALARGVLADAARQRRSIAIFEVVERRPAFMAGIVGGALASPFTLPATNPRKWDRWFFSWVLPVYQPFLLWDGLVSCLRVYSLDELRALVADIREPDYAWEARSVPLGWGINGTCLFGHPN